MVKNLFYRCFVCDKTIKLKFTDEFMAEFTATADKYPYPLIHHHEGHWAVIYLDEDFRERGVVISKISI